MSRQERRQKEAQEKRVSHFSWRNILGLILIAVGIGLILYEVVPQIRVQQTNQDNLAIAQEISAEQIQANRQQQSQADDPLADGQLIDYSDVEFINANDSLAAARATIDPSLLGGILYIPSVEIHEPIYTSLTNETLLAGSTIMRLDQEMGQGNYPLAGHNTYGSLTGSGMYFSPLDDIELGATIRITDKTNIYEYEYIDFKLVHESEVAMVEDYQADAYQGPIISLMRCEIVGLGPTENREFFIGELRSVEPYSDEAFYAPDQAADQAA